MLDQIARTIPLSTPEKKILLTPHSIHPGILKRNLALRSGQLANVHVRRLGEFFVEQAAPLFGGKAFLSGNRLFWFMAELLLSLKERLHYFGESVHFEGTCSLIAATIEELRCNGVEEDHLRSLKNTRKWEDILNIMKVYEERRKERDCFDYADAVTLLLQRPPDLEHTFVIDHATTALERRLIERCGVAVIHPLAGAEHRYALSGFRVDTQYQEALQTVRNIMEDLSGAQVPVRIGICVPEYQDAYHHLLPVLQKIGCPDMIHFLRGVPLLDTGPGNLWKYMVEWIQHSMTIQRLVRILECPGFDRGEVEPPLFHRAVGYFRRSKLVLFNAGFLSAFRDFLDGREPAAEDADGERLQAEAAKVALDIAERFHVLASPSVPWETIKALRQVFVESARIRSEQDAAAVARIEAVLEEIGEIAGTAGALTSVRDLLGILKTRLAGSYVQVTLPDATRPVLGTMNDLLFFDFDTLYLLSLNEKEMPAAFPENPVLLDDEKRALRDVCPGASLLVREDRLEEEQQRFHLLKATARRRLVMSAPLRDLATGREMLVARHLLDEWNRYHGRHEDYRAIAAALGEDPRSHNNFVTADLADSFFPYERAVSAHVRHSRGPLRRALLEESFPFAGGVAEFRKRRRVAQAFDEYWGVVRAEPSRSLPVMSATRLGLWARCPYQYFLKNELFLDREEEFDAYRLEWLDPLAYGNFLHELFYRFLIRLRAARGPGFTSVEEGDRAALEGEFALVLEKFQTLHPVTSPLHFEMTVARLRRDVEAFFERERTNTDARQFVELAFAMPDTKDREPLLKKEDPATITLADGTVLQVRGAIDRVDRRPDGRHILIDYKSGRVPRFRDSQPFGGGELLQAGLYSEVAGQVDPSIGDPLFRYYYATERAGFREYVVDYRLQRKHFLAFLTTLTREIRRGNFVPVVARSGEPPCSFCNYTDVCLEGKRWLGERLKSDDPEYERFRRVTEEEREA